jgi:hypothetical protein
MPYGDGRTSGLRYAFPQDVDDWKKNETMNGIDGIIQQLEAQKAAIDKALAALREVEGIGAAPVSPSASTGNDRRSAAQNARWAAKRAAEAASPATAKKRGRPAKKKGGMTEAGRENLRQAMNRRWALKRTAAQAKKRPGRPKKAA